MFYWTVRLLLFLALFVGCVSPRSLPWTEIPPVVDAPAVETDPRAAPPAAAATTGPESSGMLIDRALVEMNAKRGRARAQGPASTLWSKAWIECVDAIDDAVTRAPLASDLGAFVRARVTLEVELQTDRERGVALARSIPRRVAEALMRVDESVQELRAANAPGTTMAPMPRLDDGDLVLRAPLSQLIVSSPFGRRHDPFHGGVRYHAGVDLDARTGDAVYAAASGVIVYAGPQGGYGRYIVIDHGDGVRTHYAHLSEIRVAVGGGVMAGEVIGAVGSTGRSTGPHLHFAVTNALGAFLDPLAVLDIPFSVIGHQVPTKP